MSMNKRNFAAFAKSKGGGKGGKGVVPHISRPHGGGKKGNPFAKHDEDDDDDEDEDGGDEHAEHDHDDEDTEPGKKASGKKGRGGALEKMMGGGDDHDHDDDKHNGKRGRGHGRGGEDGGEDGGEVSEEEIEEIAERVQDGNGDKRLTKLARGYDPEQEDGNPPSWAQDEDIWNKAKEAVEDRMDEFDEPWVVVAHIYDEMGGEVSGGGGSGHHGHGEHDEEDDDHDHHHHDHDNE